MLDEADPAPKLYSYVIVRDYGFAPNPFFGTCTLATCKPDIRRHALVGDWVVGTGSKPLGLEGRLVFVMQIAETLTFNEYWRDKRFRCKRPNIRGSLKQAFGDNIYHRNRKTKLWVQENSHHSYPDGQINLWNVSNDTQVDRVLIATEFTYWGATGPKIPVRFRSAKTNVCALRGYKSRFPESLVWKFLEWIESLDETGYVGDPYKFNQRPRRKRAASGLK